MKGPRTNRTLWGSGTPCICGETWLESDEYCMPHGHLNSRRARVRTTDGRLRIVRCGIPDTLFSIPVSKQDGGGFITIDGDNSEFLLKGSTKFG